MVLKACDGYDCHNRDDVEDLVVVAENLLERLEALPGLPPAVVGDTAKLRKALTVLDPALAQ